MHEGSNNDEELESKELGCLVEPTQVWLPHSLGFPRKPAPAPGFRPCRA